MTPHGTPKVPLKLYGCGVGTSVSAQPLPPRRPATRCTFTWGQGRRSTTCGSSCRVTVSPARPLFPAFSSSWAVSESGSKSQPHLSLALGVGVVVFTVPGATPTRRPEHAHRPPSGQQNAHTPRTHARMHARTQTRTHARTHADTQTRTHAHTHARTRSHLARTHSTEAVCPLL